MIYGKATELDAGVTPPTCGNEIEAEGRARSAKTELVVSPPHTPFPEGGGKRQVSRLYPCSSAYGARLPLVVATAVEPDP